MCLTHSRLSANIQTHMQDENAALTNLGMRTVATPADGHSLLHAFIRTKEIKYGNSDPCNERENKVLELIKSINMNFEDVQTSTLNLQQMWKH